MKTSRLTARHVLGLIITWLAIGIPGATGVSAAPGEADEQPRPAAPAGFKNVIEKDGVRAHLLEMSIGTTFRPASEELPSEEGGTHPYQYISFIFYVEKLGPVHSGDNTGIRLLDSDGREVELRNWQWAAMNPEGLRSGPSGTMAFIPPAAPDAVGATVFRELRLLDDANLPPVFSVAVMFFGVEFQFDGLDVPMAVEPDAAQFVIEADGTS